MHCYFDFYCCEVLVLLISSSASSLMTWLYSAISSLQIFSKLLSLEILKSHRLLAFSLPSVNKSFGSSRVVSFFHIHPFSLIATLKFKSSSPPVWTSALGTNLHNCWNDPSILFCSTLLNSTLLYPLLLVNTKNNLHLN